MYVCVCNGVTEQQIREAVRAGAATVSELGSKLGVAAGCGCCHAFAAQVLVETLEVYDLAENRAAA